jgi:hypothetical protein
MNVLPESDNKQPPTWTLIRDVAVLQVKLIADGLRDLVLVPASLIAGIVSLVKSEGGKPGPQFYTLVGVGRQSERWIDLFGAYKNAPPEVVEKNHFGNTSMDEIVSRMESFVVDEYKRGGITAQAKKRIDKALVAMQRRRTGADENGQ